MNTAEALEQLQKLFNEFHIHELCITEFAALLRNELKGKERQFFKTLTFQLNNLRTFGSQVHLIDSNERIKGMDGHYYSIHFQGSQFNIRLLVYISDDSAIYLLCIFYERGGKKRTSYERYKPTLKTRLNDLINQ